MGPTSITGAVVASNESLIKYSEDGAAIRTVVAGTLDGLVQELTSADQSSDSSECIASERGSGYFDSLERFLALSSCH